MLLVSLTTVRKSWKRLVRFEKHDAKKCLLRNEHSTTFVRDYFSYGTITSLSIRSTSFLLFLVSLDTKIDGHVEGCFQLPCSATNILPPSWLPTKMDYLPRNSVHLLSESLVKLLAHDDGQIGTKSQCLASNCSSFASEYNGFTDHIPHTLQWA